MHVSFKATAGLPSQPLHPLPVSSALAVHVWLSFPSQAPGGLLEWGEDTAQMEPPKSRSFIPLFLHLFPHSAFILLFCAQRYQGRVVLRSTIKEPSILGLDSEDVLERQELGKN